ncbi:nuclear transport factor 2 family protein [Paraglaciecola chathamensis]|uniref:nuclear transport factor 2 family protein n=1 Tax=Paraglaciecola chathamensis TaxID=368405 RepID=UPI002704B10D|nr:nuclear transport factor 2 family protein [Paraglaciecola chathamensis]MDO6558946.1 nuclear transport factor 2 family protein [Paraglaciecola chathamensis]
MKELSIYESQVKQTIENLIQLASHFDLKAIDQIYHDDMQVVMVDPVGKAHTSDKNAFKQMIQERKDEGTPMNTWVQFQHVQASAERGLVVLSRKNNLAGQDMLLNLSIDLKYEDGRWQVTREIIFLHPESTSNLN